MSLRIGSLCTGYAGLDEAVQDVFGGIVAWHCQYDPDDKHQYAAQILAHHWPQIPNHGDITAIDFAAVEPIDILTAGFPCQDVSLAGKRAGIADGTRSGLWAHVARAIAALRPRLVVIENVPGLLSSPADSDVEPCPWCLGDPEDEPPLRALGAVLGDLAGLGFDAQWTSLPASAVGACHRRNRVFILAWPAHSPSPGLEGTRISGRPAQRGGAAAPDTAGGGRRHEPGLVGGLGSEERGSRPAADADSDALREQSVPVSGRGGAAVAGLAGAGAAANSEGHAGRVIDGDGAASADAQGDGRYEGRPEPAGFSRGSHAPVGGGAASADADGGGLPQHPQRHRHQDAGQSAPLRDDALQPDAQRHPAPDAHDLRRQRGGQHGDGGPDLRTAVGALADPDGERGDERREPASGEEAGGRTPAVDCGCDRASWGRYADAVHRWEQLMGRPAPAPVDERGRLAPAFVEWMQGLPEGHVTGVPGLPRNAQLKALGNGVVPRQAEAAIRLLHARAAEQAGR